MTLRDTLTGPEHDEIGKLLLKILTDVKVEGRPVEDAVSGLRQAFAAALCQNPNFMSEIRSAAGA